MDNYNEDLNVSEEEDLIAIEDFESLEDNEIDDLLNKIEGEDNE